jgi:TonB family protein
MNPQDLNPLLDPESVPIPAAHDRTPRSQAQLNVDSFDLFGSVDRSPVTELNEEPPWLAEFLVHYKLLFGTGQTETAAKDRVQPIRIADPPAIPEQASRTNRENQDIEPGPLARVSTPGKEEKPQETLQFRVSEGWSWIHFAIAVTLAALLFALMFMLGLAHKQKLDTSLPTPTIGTHLANLQAAPLMSSLTSVADLDSHADIRPTAPPQQKLQTGLAAPTIGAHLANLQAAPLVSSLTSVADLDGQADISSTTSLRKTLPIYPSAALAEKLEGNVLLQLDISPRGQVTGVTVLSGDPILARAAVAAVWQWVYPPSKQDEVRQQQITIRFRVP